MHIRLTYNITPEIKEFLKARDNLHSNIFYGKPYTNSPVKLLQSRKAYITPHKMLEETVRLNPSKRSIIEKYILIIHYTIS